MSKKKIFIDVPLLTLPSNGLFMLNGKFYRRGCVNRSTHEIQVVRDSIAKVEISFVPRSTRVNYYRGF